MSQLVKVVVDDKTYIIDSNRFMLQEAIGLEEQWGLSVAEFGTAITSGAPSMRVVGAMVWLVKVRAIAAENGISFPDAAKQLPAATFDTNLAALLIEPVEEPVGPTPGVTPTPKTRTTRTTSAAKRSKRA